MPLCTNLRESVSTKSASNTGRVKNAGESRPLRIAFHTRRARRASQARPQAGAHRRAERADNRRSQFALRRSSAAQRPFGVEAGRTAGYERTISQVRWVLPPSTKITSWPAAWATSRSSVSGSAFSMMTLITDECPQKKICLRVRRLARSAPAHGALLDPGSSSQRARAHINMRSIARTVCGVSATMMYPPPRTGFATAVICRSATITRAPTG